MSSAKNLGYKQSRAKTRHLANMVRDTEVFNGVFHVFRSKFGRFCFVGVPSFWTISEARAGVAQGSVVQQTPHSRERSI